MGQEEWRADLMYTKPLLTDTWGGSHWCSHLSQKEELTALQPLPKQPEH